MHYVRRIGLFVLASSVCGKNVGAAEWELAGTLGQQLQYNDNIAFSSIRKDSVFGYLLAPELHASRKTADLDLVIQGRGDIRRYTDPIWDCESFSTGANSAYRTNRSTFGLNGGYGTSCTYVQQITDTGLIVPNNRAKNYHVAPSWTWQWTARDQLMLDTSYSKTSYSTSQNGIASSNNSSFFSGNDTYTVSLGGNHEWNRRLSFDGKLYFSDIQYTGSSNSTQNLYGFQLGGNYKIDRLWTIAANAGPVWIDTQAGSNEASSSSVQSSSLSLDSTANINLNYNGQLTKFSTGYSKAVSPSALGQALQTQSFFASYSYSLTRHLMLDLSSNYLISNSTGNNSIVNSNSQFNRDYFTVTTGITWDIAKHWQLTGSYAYRWQDYQQDQNVQNINGLTNFNTGKSKSNLVMLFLNYSWDGIRVSR
ncbi:MAG: hypothetical protein ACR65R_05665 [Methylomicrobium sp.]